MKFFYKFEYIMINLEKQDSQGDLKIPEELSWQILQLQNANINPTVGLVLLGHLRLEDALSIVSAEDLDLLSIYWWEFLRQQAIEVIQTKRVDNIKDIHHKRKLLELFLYDDKGYDTFDQKIEKDFQKLSSYSIHSYTPLEELVEVFRVFDERSNEVYILLQLIREACGENFKNVTRFDLISSIYNLYITDDNRILYRYIDDIEWFESLQRKKLELGQKELESADTLAKAIKIHKSIAVCENCAKTHDILPEGLDFKIDVKNKVIELGEKELENLDIESLLYLKKMLLSPVRSSSDLYTKVTQRLLEVLKKELNETQDLKRVVEWHRILRDEFKTSETNSEFFNKFIAKEYELGKLELQKATNTKQIFEVCELLAISDFLIHKSPIISLLPEFEELLAIARAQKKVFDTKEKELWIYVSEQRTYYLSKKNPAKELIWTLTQKTKE